jgi:hypothetical protein
MTFMIDDHIVFCFIDDDEMAIEVLSMIQSIRSKDKLKKVL